jgi:hypothetical protein
LRQRRRQHAECTNSSPSALCAATLFMTRWRSSRVQTTYFSLTRARTSTSTSTRARTRSSTRAKLACAWRLDRERERPDGPAPVASAVRQGVRKLGDTVHVGRRDVEQSRRVDESRGAVSESCALDEVQFILRIEEGERIPVDENVVVTDGLHQLLLLPSPLTPPSRASKRPLAEERASAPQPPSLAQASGPHSREQATPHSRRSGRARQILRILRALRTRALALHGCARFARLRSLFMCALDVCARFTRVALASPFINALASQARSPNLGSSWYPS